MKYFNMVNILIWIPCMALFAIIPIGLMQIILKKRIKKKMVRKCLVMLYKIMEKTLFLVMMIPMLLILIETFRYVHTLVFFTCFSVSKNYDLSNYITWSIILVGIEPITVLCGKMLRKQWYKEENEKAYQKWMIIEFFDRSIIMFNKFPIKGMMHIINLWLVVLANTSKLVNMDLGLTTNIIYI